MNSISIAFILIAYFSILLIIAFYTSRDADNKAFFIGNKQSPWWIVAIGMIGTSISGVTFISVPGQVGKIQFAYFQLVLGYIVGYIFIGLVLMPLYYRLNVTSIYTYLEQRFGKQTYKTGASFFLLSRTLGSAARLYLAALVFQQFVFEPLGISFPISVFLILVLIWLYTYKGGIRTIVYTDTLQSLFLILAPILSVYFICKHLDISLLSVWQILEQNHLNKILVTNDFMLNKLHFVKQFIGGALIATAMTGLDQDLMQKNISCKNIHSAQKNMITFVSIMVFINFMFLCLGGLLYVYAHSYSVTIPSKTDLLYPTLALEHFSPLVGVIFILGLTAAAFASSDSALTALTTSFCVDFLGFEKRENINPNMRHYVHIGFSVLFLVLILFFYKMNNQAVIDLIFKIAAYTYGPLLGMYMFGLFTKKSINDNLSWLICLLSPALCWIIEMLLSENNIYKFGNELLLLNGFITFVGFLLISKKE